MDTIVSGGVPIALDAVGEGEPVTVAAHGLTGSRRDLGPLAPFLPGTKVLFDFRGHGESGRPPAGSYSMEHFASDLAAVADAYGATRAAGVSLGAGAILRVVRKRPDRFERLVLLLPARGRDSAAYRKLTRLARRLEREPLERLAEAVVREEAADGELGGLTGGAERRRQAVLGMNADAMPAAIREAIDDTPVRDAEALRRVTAPVLIVAQDRDPVHTAAAARELADGLPNAELILYADRFALLRDIAGLTQRVSEFIAG